MDDFILARTLHLLAVLIWIGGVAFVTSVVMPSIRRNHAPAERLAAFHRIEARFAPQARVWVPLAGASGLWMIYRGHLWSRFADAHFWWMHAMVFVWLIFLFILFVAEPLFLHRRMRTSTSPARDFERMEIMHRVLLTLSLIAVLGAAAGSRGAL